jgi:hypothetical protein
VLGLLAGAGCHSPSLEALSVGIDMELRGAGGFAKPLPVGGGFKLGLANGAGLHVESIAPRPPDCQGYPVQDLKIALDSVQAIMYN